MKSMRFSKRRASPQSWLRKVSPDVTDFDSPRRSRETVHDAVQFSRLLWLSGYGDHFISDRDEWNSDRDGWNSDRDGCNPPTGSVFASSSPSGLNRTSSGLVLTTPRSNTLSILLLRPAKLAPPRDDGVLYSRPANWFYDPC